MDYFNRKYIFQPLIFRGHVSFPGSTCFFFSRKSILELDVSTNDRRNPPDGGWNECPVWNNLAIELELEYHLMIVLEVPSSGRTASNWFWMVLVVRSLLHEIANVFGWLQLPRCQVYFTSWIHLPPHQFDSNHNVVSLEDTSHIQLFRILSYA